MKLMPHGLVKLSITFSSLYSDAYEIDENKMYIKIVINIFIMTSLFCLLQILQAGLWLHKIMHLNDNSLSKHVALLQHRKPLSI